MQKWKDQDCVCWVKRQSCLSRLSDGGISMLGMKTVNILVTAERKTTGRRMCLYKQAVGPDITVDLMVQGKVFWR